MRRAASLLVLVLASQQALVAAAPVCSANPVYLTFDTGPMDVAPLIADVLRRQNVKATFFVANEPTRSGGETLDNQWATWWKALAGQGHEFASQTYDHVYWRSDLPGIKPNFRMKPTSGALAGREFTYDPAKYCAQIERAARRIEDFTGKKSLPVFRAPGGKASPKLLAAAQACGYAHAAWSRYVGDELSSVAYPTDKLLAATLRDTRSGDILMAHLGSWSRDPPWAPAGLEPLIVGLKERGFCFESLRNHPAYRDWIAAQAR
jgi:peptidoglycan/xylan/chitin deacetylase (PgdA/CDA1 family)